MDVELKIVCREPIISFKQILDHWEVDAIRHLKKQKCPEPLSRPLNFCLQCKSHEVIFN